MTRTASARRSPEEDIVFHLMKELFAFGYNATERLEERASEFEKMRHERMEEFRREREKAHAAARPIFEERTEELRGRVSHEVQHVLREAGLATREEVDDLKAILADLGAKLDAAAAGRPPRTTRSARATRPAQRTGTGRGTRPSRSAKPKAKAPEETTGTE
jgi:hypothetical protein